MVRDRRKIDPQTGEIRHPEEVGHNVADLSAGPALGQDAVTPAPGLEKELAERTADLQRLQAEYANYRKRVERDRGAVVTAAKASVAAELLPLLDDIERAEAHGDLNGPFKAVTDKLLASLQKVGLESYGAEGEPFDPSVHEAVMHATSSDVDGPTVTTVMRRGYRFGERVLRPAMVGVTDHEPSAGEPQPDAESPLPPAGPAAQHDPATVDKPADQPEDTD